MENQKGDRKILHDFVREGDLNSIRQCLASGCDVNNRDELGNPAIVYANFSESHIVKMLVEAGVDINLSDPKKRNSLHFAVAEENLELIKYLINAGIDLNARDCYGRTPLHVAVKYGCLEIVKLLVAKGAQTEHCQSCPLLIYDHENTVLSSFLVEHFPAVQFSNFSYPESESSLAMAEIISDGKFKQLMKQTNDVNMLDENGFSLLHLAAFRGNAQHVRLLLEKGAKISMCTETCLRQTPLHLAVLGRSLDNYEVIELLLERGADLSSVDAHGRTPLHLLVSDATARNRLVLFSLFIRRGANIMARTADGNTVLHFAVFDPHARSSFDIIKCLLRLGAKMHSTNEKGETPLKFALKHRDLSVVKLFLEQNKKLVRMCTALGETVLHYAARNPDVEVISYLVNHKIDVNVIDKSGFAAIHYAAQCSNYRAVAQLVYCGAKVNFDDHKGLSPLHFALGMQDDWTTKILLEFGADINYRQTTEGESVLKRGLVNGDSKILRNLIKSVALLKYQNKEVAEDGWKIITANNNLSNYHEQCLSELTQLAAKKFDDNLTCVDLLIQKESVLASFAKNKDFAKDFITCSDKYRKSYPKYYYLLNARLRFIVGDRGICNTL